MGSLRNQNLNGFWISKGSTSLPLYESLQKGEKVQLNILGLPRGCIPARLLDLVFTVALIITKRNIPRLIPSRSRLSGIDLRVGNTNAAIYPVLNSNMTKSYSSVRRNIQFEYRETRTVRMGLAEAEAVRVTFQTTRARACESL